MTGKQFLDQEGLTELVSQTKSYMASEIAATRNYVDDRLSIGSTPPSGAKVVFQSDQALNQGLYSSSTFTYSSLGLAALKGTLTVDVPRGESDYVELTERPGGLPGSRTIDADNHSSVYLYVETADIGTGNQGEDVRLVITNAADPSSALSSSYVSLANNYTYWIQLFGTRKNVLPLKGMTRIYRMPASGGSWSFVKSIEYSAAARFFLLCVGGNRSSGSGANAVVHFIAS